MNAVYRSATLSAILLALGLILLGWKLLHIKDPDEYATHYDINSAVATRDAQDTGRVNRVITESQRQHDEVMRGLKKLEKAQQQHEAEIEKLERRTR